MTGIETAALAPYILGVSVAGVAVSAYSAYSQGQNAKQQVNAEAAWNTYNSKVAQRQADAERQAAAFESQQQKRQAKQLLSRQRVLIGASGVEMEGSPLLVAEDTAAQLALENTNIRTQGTRRSMAYESQSILDIMKAKASKTAAGNYGTAGVINAGGSLLQGGAQAGYQYYQMKK
jgi:hypothetical protein